MCCCAKTWPGDTIESTPPSCLMKVDSHKAFDSVHWEFIKELLSALKFPSLFIQWVMKYISSVKFAICINGQEGDFFKGKRELKQGDPLSPLLFILTMEYLSKLFKLASLQKEFAFYPHYKKLGLTHLIFADDLVLFCKAHPQSLQILMKTFQSFTQCTGLKANMEKSIIVFGGGEL